MEFHEKLQELRKQKNLTQEELSEILFVSRTAISKWESGRGYPSIDSLKAIAEFFGVTKTILSMILTIISVVIFIASLQPYVAFFTFVLLIIKGALLLKRP